MEDTPMVQLGDASTAAPFTTRTPSISSVALADGGPCGSSYYTRWAPNKLLVIYKMGS